MAAGGHGMPAAQFTFEAVELYRTQPIGKGSYGLVCKAKCDKLPCAAKLLHPIFFHSNDPGLQNTITRFEMECDFLSSIRHPNIVLHLGTYRDPETGLPVLLMELMDESLTSFLDCATSSLSLRTQINFCHDIALALAYLHSRDIIHRDLSSNNILLIAGGRAKVSDFGMSKLVDAQSHFTPLTQCPGCPVYMAPEALLVPPQYSKKLDCFSFGVLGIQIITRCFPSPGPRMITVPDQRSPIGVIQIPVSEVERRKNDLDLIGSDHVLKPLLLECLQDDCTNRPTSGELCDRLMSLKEDASYTANYLQLQGGVQDNRGQEAKDRQIQNLQLQVEQLQLQLQLKEVQSSEPHGARRPPDDGSNGSGFQHRVVCSQAPQKSHLPAVKMQKHEDAPALMVRGSAVVDPAKNIAYFNSSGSDMICSYDVATSSWDQRLLKCPRTNFALAIVNGLLTSVGGFEKTVTGSHASESRDLCSFEAGKWSVDIFPPMPTARWDPAVASFQEWLIVAGGIQGTRTQTGAQLCLTHIEVLDSDTKQWSIATPLPRPLQNISMTVCGERVYIFGCEQGQKYTPALSISVVGLTHGTTKSWEQLPSTAHLDPTCASFKGNLLAVGGTGTLMHQPKSDVHRYDPTSNTWVLIGQLVEPRHMSIVVALPNDKLLVVGGATNIMWSIMSNVVRTGSTVVEIGGI